MKIVAGQRTDRRDQPAFTSKAQRGSEGTRAALEAPEYDVGIPNAGHESCTVSDTTKMEHCIRAVDLVGARHGVALWLMANCKYQKHA